MLFYIITRVPIKTKYQIRFAFQVTKKIEDYRLIPQCVKYLYIALDIFDQSVIITDADLVII